jgi:hypothetical protein
MATIHGSCLCGDIAWETSGEPAVMSHCHCSRCRKTHGAAFGTYLMAPAAGFRLTRGRGRMVRRESSPGFFRPFCGRCGSVVPDGTVMHDQVFVPAGPLDDDPGVRPLAHIFVASKAPWVDIRDALPRFEAYPPGFEAPVVPDPPAEPAGTSAGSRGSCLCGGVAYVVEGELLRCWNCHCSRCRKARAAAYASNLITGVDAVRFTRGEDLLVTYKVPEAHHFAQVFCRVCGSPMPRRDPERTLAFIPMGSLDDDPGIRPSRHIFAASKAPWYEIPDALPQDETYPTA